MEEFGTHEPVFVPVPLDYDPDSEESVKVRPVLQDVKTKFVPTTAAYQSRHRVTRNVPVQKVNIIMQSSTFSEPSNFRKIHFIR